MLDVALTFNKISQKTLGKGRNGGHPLFLKSVNDKCIGIHAAFSELWRVWIAVIWWYECSYGRVSRSCFLFLKPFKPVSFFLSVRVSGIANLTPSVEISARRVISRCTCCRSSLLLMIKGWNKKLRLSSWPPRDNHSPPRHCGQATLVLNTTIDWHWSLSTSCHTYSASIRSQRGHPRFWIRVR